MVSDHKTALTQLASQLLGLCQKLTVRGGIRTRPYHRDPDFTVISMTDDYEPSSTLYVSAAGMVIRHTCEYSHHNGDSYGNEEELLVPAEAYDAMKALLDRLVTKAVAIEEKHLEELVSKQRKAEAERNIAAFLEGVKS